MCGTFGCIQMWLTCYPLNQSSKLTNSNVGLLRLLPNVVLQLENSSEHIDAAGLLFQKMSVAVLRGWLCKVWQLLSTVSRFQLASAREGVELWRVAQKQPGHLSQVALDEMTRYLADRTEKGELETKWKGQRVTAYLNQILLAAHPPLSSLSNWRPAKPALAAGFQKFERDGSGHVEKFEEE